MKAEFHDGVIQQPREHVATSRSRRSSTATRSCAQRFAPLVPLFERMDELAKLMRKRRYERGSLDFDLPEPKLVLDAGRRR